jgi:anti-sigma regulatory factor (Ser/Thr protein kinase)
MTTSTRTPGEGDRRELALDLERGLEAPAMARAAIVGFCQDRQLPAGTMATLMLLVSELVTNAVIHPDLDPAGTIALRARLHDEAVRVEVADDGEGFSPKPRPPEQVGGGYGLYLVQKEATHWGVEVSPHTTVWFEVAIPAA